MSKYSCFDATVTVNYNGAELYDSIVTTITYIKHNGEDLVKDGMWPDSRRLFKPTVRAASNCRDVGGVLGKKARELLEIIEEIEDWYDGH